MPASNQRKYLIVGPSWVGDMVMSQALYKLLKKRHPDCIIDVVAPGWSLPIIERMPEINQGIDLGIGHGPLALKPRYKLGKSLAHHNYSHSITTPGSWKSALVPMFAGAKVRTGFLRELRYGLLNDIRRLDKKLLPTTVERYLALGLDRNEDIKSLNWDKPKLTVDEANFARLQAEFGLQPGLVAVALMPGAEHGPAKQWPIEYHQQLAEALALKGYQVWVLGSAKDAAAGAQIAASNHPNIYNLCGKTQLVDAVDLLAKAQHAITNDSGLMHVAAAVGTKVHAIYGSSDPAHTPPLTENKVIHYLALDCSPCFKKECPLGHTNCLKDITVQAVLEAIDAE